MLLGLRGRGASARRVWIVAFGAFNLLMIGWALAMPPDGTTDERQHIERAYGVVTGHVVAQQDFDPMFHRPGGVVAIPKSLLPVNANCPYFPNYTPDLGYIARSAACQEEPSANHARVRVVSWVGRYNPVFYAVVGGPLRFLPNQAGIILARCLACALAAAFAATAAAIAAWSRRPLLLGAVIVLMTPAAVALGSTVNPNGVEITAAILFWVCLIDLARSDRKAVRRVPDPVLITLATVSGAVLLTVRALGPVWFTLAVVAAAAVARPGRLRELSRGRRARGAAVVLGAAGLAAVVWNRLSGNDVVNKTTLALTPRDHRLGTLLRVILVKRVGGWFDEVVALDLQAQWVLFLWAGLAAVVVLPALLACSRRVSVVAVLIASASLGLTVVLEVHYLSTLGWSQFGRYFLPGLAGAALLATAASREAMDAVVVRRLLRFVAACAGALQVWVLAVEMTRVQAGPSAPIDPLGGKWHPMTGSWLPLLAEIAGAALLVLLVRGATRAEGVGLPGQGRSVSEPRAALVGDRG